MSFNRGKIVFLKCYVKISIISDTVVQPDIVEFMKNLELEPKPNSKAKSQQNNNNNRGGSSENRRSSTESQENNTMSNEIDSQKVRRSGRIEANFRRITKLEERKLVPFSSPLGMFLAKEPETPNYGEASDERLGRIEKLSDASTLYERKRIRLNKPCKNNEQCAEDEPVSDPNYVRKFHVLRKSTKKKPVWDTQSQILHQNCKPYLYPLVTPLTKQEIKERKRDQSQNKSPGRNVIRGLPSVEPILENGVIDLEDD